MSRSAQYRPGCIIAAERDTKPAIYNRDIRVDAGLKAALVSSAVVGSGGFIGALARYGLGGLVHRQLPLAVFPYGTLLVNLAGCLFIGVLAGLAESRQLFGPQFRQFAMIGILGGFTTFSTFGFETVAMLRDADFVRAGANIGLNVVAGLALVWLGYQVAVMR